MTEQLNATKQALEALEEVRRDLLHLSKGGFLNLREVDLELGQKITAIKQAEKQEPAQVQEPYGQVTVVKRPGCVDQHWFYRWPEPPYLDNAAECYTLYTTPPTYDQGWKDGYKHGAWAASAIKQDLTPAPAAPVQEPVGCMRCTTPKKCAAWGCSPNTWPSENTTPPAAQRQSAPDPKDRRSAWVGLTKTIVGNHLRRHMLGDQPTFRQGFKEGMAFAEAKLRELNGAQS